MTQDTFIPFLDRLTDKQRKSFAKRVSKLKDKIGKNLAGQPERTIRFTIRIQPAHLATIRGAARRENRTITNFIKTAALDRAGKQKGK